MPAPKQEFPKGGFALQGHVRLDSVFLEELQWMGRGAPATVHLIRGGSRQRNETAKNRT